MFFKPETYKYDLLSSVEKQKKNIQIILFCAPQDKTKVIQGHLNFGCTFYKTTMHYFL